MGYSHLMMVIIASILNVVIPVWSYLFLVAVMLGFQSHIDNGDRWYHYLFAVLWPITIICWLFTSFLEFFCWLLSISYNIGNDFGRMYTKKDNMQR